MNGMAKSEPLQWENRHLAVAFDVVSGSFDVVQKATGVLWKMDRADRGDLHIVWRGDEPMVLALSAARTKTVAKNADGSRRITYGNFAGIDSSLEVAVLLELRERDLWVELDVNDADPRVRFASLYYPRAFLLPARNENYWIVPTRGGKLVPATYRRDLDARRGWKTTLRCHGAVQGPSGFLCLWDAPYDTLLAETNSTRTGPKFFGRSMESLGRFRYRRGFRFCFREKTTYADLIRQVYRPLAERRGYLVPLAKRAEVKPRIKDLPGTSIWHQLIAYVDRRSLQRTFVTFDHARRVFEQMVEQTGLRKGLYHLDGWCRQGYDALHPDVLPPFAEAGGEKGMGELSKAVARKGFHFGLHDNYMLFFPDAEQFSEADAIWTQELRPYRDQFRAGGMNFVQSPPASLRFLVRNYSTGNDAYRRIWRPITAYCRLGFCYLDQFLISGGGFDQDFNPAHPMTRDQFARGMLEVIDVLGKRLGLITSSEHMYEFANPHYDVNGNGGGLAVPAPEEGVVPVPLWSLAFHECMVVTDVPRGPANFIACALIGGAMHHRNGHSYGTDEAWLTRLFECIRRAAPLRALHEEIAFRECTGSKLLSADGSVQEVEFENVVVRGDFGRMRLAIDGSRGADGEYRFDDLASE
jgi:hypothetical protein